jgi:hypothetical protein
LLVSNHLKRKIAVFLKNMDQTEGSLSPISLLATRHLSLATNPVTNEAVMLLKIKAIIGMGVCSIPDWIRKSKSVAQAARFAACGFY